MQHGLNIANESGLLFRGDVNNALQSLATNSSGTTAPATTYPFQFWVDTSGSSPYLKQRNAANSGWNVIGRLDVDGFGLNGVVSGTSAPSSPLAYELWVDTSGTVAGYGTARVLKIWNPAASGGSGAWINLGNVDLTEFGFANLSGTQSLSNKTFSNATTFQAQILGNNATNSAATGASQTLSAVATTLLTVTNASLTSVAGVASPTNNQFFVLVNGTGAAITIQNQSASAAAGVKITTGTGSDISLANGASLWLYYSPTSTSWQIVGGSGGGGSSTLTTQTGSTYSVLNTDGAIVCNPSGAMTVTLPTAVGIAGKSFNIKNISAFVVTISTTSSQLIDGDLQKTISQKYDSLQLISDGTNWFLI